MAPPNTCRELTVNAIQVPIVYNAYGQFDNNGAMYVLDENLEAIRAATRPGGPTINSDGTPKASIQNPNHDVTVPLVEG